MRKNGLPLNDPSVQKHDLPTCKIINLINTVQKHDWPTYKIINLINTVQKQDWPTCKIINLINPVKACNKDKIRTFQFDP